MNANRRSTTIPRLAKSSWRNVAYEKEVLGFSFGDNLCDYDLSYADRNPQSCVGGEIVKYRKHKTKTGKPMAFVTIQGHQAQRDYVSFDDKVVLNVGKVYLLRINAKGHIVDATEAQKKNQA
jgi:DNA polymerase III alpha subunit